MKLYPEGLPEFAHAVCEKYTPIEVAGFVNKLAAVEYVARRTESPELWRHNHAVALQRFKAAFA